MNRPASIHWLRENHQERSPHRVLIVDTETRPVGPQDASRQELRLWCATLLRRHDVDPRRPRVEHFRGETAGELADLVAANVHSDHALWTGTHNLNFDLAVTQLPVRLAERGFRVTEAALTTDSPWCRMAAGSRRLTIFDTWSFLPASVEDLGAMLGLRKLRLPGPADDAASWYARCERDVEIAVRALTQLMDWWDEGRYGNWTLTGPATGWSSYRHRKPAPRVLVNPDPQARAFEAGAVMGGRRLATQLGMLRPGLYADLDFATAHLTVMSECLLPCRRLRRFESLPLDDPHLTSAVMDVLADCEVETATPRYPWNSGAGVFYPVGRFVTRLAGPEIREARQRGELRSIGPGYVYLLSPHMQGWARWLASLLAEETPDVPPAVRLAAKHWSHCVPGKWAGRTSEVVMRTPDPRPGWRIERGYIAADHSPADFLTIGGELWTIRRDLWADDAFPAILAWIQAHTRVALSRLIDALGPSVVCANTDGVLVDVDMVPPNGAGWRPDPSAAVGARLRWLDSRTYQLDTLAAPFTLRVKGAYRMVTVYSPQHLLLSGERRLAGIPRKSQHLNAGQYHFTQWPKLRVQLLRDEGPGYRTQERTVNLAIIPPAGWLLADDRTEPLELHTEEGREGPVLWQQSPWHDQVALAPAERQHPLLRRLLRSQTPQDGPGPAMLP